MRLTRSLSPLGGHQASASFATDNCRAAMIALPKWIMGFSITRYVMDAMPIVASVAPAYMIAKSADGTPVG